jgi:hypothetical protein
MRPTPERIEEIRTPVTGYEPQEHVKELLAEIDALQAERDKYLDDWFAAISRECETDHELEAERKAHAETKENLRFKQGRNGSNVIARDKARLERDHQLERAEWARAELVRERSKRMVDAANLEQERDTLLECVRDLIFVLEKHNQECLRTRCKTCDRVEAIKEIRQRLEAAGIQWEKK